MLLLKKVREVKKGKCGSYTEPDVSFFLLLLHHKLATRMAVATTPLPPAFLQCPGDPAMPFETWLWMFQNDLLVIDVEGEKWPDSELYCYTASVPKHRGFSIRCLTQVPHMLML